MSCLRCPTCGSDRTRTRIYPRVCTCGYRATSAADWTAIADCDPPARRPPGAGSFLKADFAALGFYDDGTCGCDELAALMNDQGPAWCRANFDALLDRLVENAEKRGIRFGRIALWFLLDMAIAAAERAAGSEATPPA